MVLSSRVSLSASITTLTLRPDLMAADSTAQACLIYLLNLLSFSYCLPCNQPGVSRCFNHHNGILNFIYVNIIDQWKIHRMFTNGVMPLMSYTLFNLFFSSFVTEKNEIFIDYFFENITYLISYSNSKLRP